MTIKEALAHLILKYESKHGKTPDKNSLKLIEKEAIQLSRQATEKMRIDKRRKGYKR